MRVVCPRCGEPIPGENIDVARNHAVCTPCGEVLALPDFGPHAAGGELAIAAPSELARALPDEAGLAVAGAARFRPVALPWKESALAGVQHFWLAPRRLMALPILGFAAIWNAFLVFWYTIALVSHGGPGSIMFWFPLIHVGAGLYITYKGLTMLVNRTRISIDRERVRLHAGPIPQRGGNIDEPTTNVRGFDMWRQESTQPRGGTAIRYSVRMLTDDGRSLTLPFDLTDSEHATWIAARLNHALDEARAPHSYRD